MTKLEIAARQIIVDWDSGIHLYEAITALLEALAEQAEQEPVAYRVWDRMGGISYRRTKPSKSEYVEWDTLYAAPVRTKDLTDDEILKAFGITGCVPTTRERVLKDARAVIAADREKNK